MRVLIAGCGYVGCALAEMLRDAGHQVTGLRRSASALPDGIDALAADLADPTALRSALNGHRFDWVVYATAADGRSEAAYRTAYVDGLSHLLDVIVVPERFVFTSSTAVYGQSEGEIVDETSPTKPARFTGEIMLEAEELVGHYDTTSTAVRFGGIYGPGRTRLIDRVRDGAAVLPSGQHITNRIHRQDCAGVLAHVLALDDPAPIYIGVDDTPADQREVLTWIAGRLEVDVPPVSEEAPPRRGKRCNNRLLRSSGYAFRYPSYREGYGELM